MERFLSILVFGKLSQVKNATKKPLCPPGGHSGFLVEIGIISLGDFLKNNKKGSK